MSRVAVARLGQHHGHQVTSPPLLLEHVVTGGSLLVSSVVSGHGTRPHCWWRGWDRSAVGQLGSPPAVVLAASLAAAY